MGDTATDDPILDEIVRRIVEVADPDRIILFGSRARGDARPDSDYDILVIGPIGDGPGHRSTPLYSALGGVPVGCDILWESPEEVEHWQGARSHVLARAMREGRAVYARAA
jgi:uncharacterized protein